MNKIVNDWETLPPSIKVMTTIGSILTLCCAYNAVFNINDSGDFLAAIFGICYFGWTLLIFPGIVSRAARARGGRMLKWYLFAFFLGVFPPIVGMIIVVAYYKYFWCDKHPLTVPTHADNLIRADIPS